MIHKEKKRGRKLKRPTSTITKHILYESNRSKNTRY